MYKHNLIVSKFALAVGIIAAMPGMSAASDMALTFKDNGITISGDFVAFEQDAYVIATSAGEVYIPSKYVTCEGQDCIVNVQLAANTTVAE